MDKVTSIRKTSDLVHIIAAATPTLIYTLSQGRTAKIKKVMLMNYTAANDFVTFGEGAGIAFVPGMPAIVAVANLDEQLGEWDIPQYEFETNIYAQVPAGSAVGALTPLDVLVETEEIG